MRFDKIQANASAIKFLDEVINENRAVEYKRHNRYMGSRHELGGKRGRYPIKCARIVRTVVVNAAANAANKGETPDYMYVVHASANKTQEVPRAPPKGVRAVGTGGYGFATMRKSNLAFAKVEIGIADKEVTTLGAKMKRAIKAVDRTEKPIQEAAAKNKQKAPKGLVKQSNKQQAQKQPAVPKQEVKQEPKPQVKEEKKVETKEEKKTETKRIVLHNGQHRIILNNHRCKLGNRNKIH